MWEACRSVSCFKCWDKSNKRQKKKNSKDVSGKYLKGVNKVQRGSQFTWTLHSVCVCVSVRAYEGVFWCMEVCVEKSINVRLDPAGLTSRLEVVQLWKRVMRAVWQGWNVGLVLVIHLFYCRPGEILLPVCPAPMRKCSEDTSFGGSADLLDSWNSSRGDMFLTAGRAQM